MPEYRRHYFPNSYVFITSITKNRNAIFLKQENVTLLFETINTVLGLYPFNLYAYVIMPDHFHWIIELGDGFQDFSKIVHSFKRNFTLNYKKEHNINHTLSLWQKRFWDHVIRDEPDLQNHLDYIHRNPVKHKMVDHPNQYQFSSFQKFVESGIYSNDWGIKEMPQIIKSVGSE